MALNCVFLICSVLSFSCLVSTEQVGNAVGGKDADSEARLQAVMDLMVKSANSSTNESVASPNQSEAHKQMNAVLDQWADFIEAVKNDPPGPQMPPGAKPGRRSASKQTRWFNNNNNNNNNNYNNNNNDQGASPAEEVHENYYYANQGYYSRKGSPGTQDKKAPKAPTAPSKSAPTSPASDSVAPPKEKPENSNKQDQPDIPLDEVPEQQSKDDKPIF